VEPIISVTPRKLNDITGYRLMDTEILASIIKTLGCPSCFFDSLSLHENSVNRSGLCSFLYIICEKCNNKIEFNTSKNTEKRFDINIRAAYTFRSLGHSHSGIEKFTALIDLCFD